MNHPLAPSPATLPNELETGIGTGKMILPDYAGRGFFNLAVSLARVCGTSVPAHYADLTVPGLSVAQWSSRQDIVLFLVDGLGDGFLVRHRDLAPNLWRDRVAALASVFPSTTATAITTLMTAAPACVHGLLGWFVRDEASGRLIAPLPMRYRNNGPVEDAAASRVLSAPPILAHTERSTHIVTLSHLAGGPYSLHYNGSARTHVYEGLSDIPQTVRRALTGEQRTKRFVYCYTPLLDAMGHDHGSDSPETQQVLREIDGTYAALRRLLPKALIIVAADHGFIDSPAPRNIDLNAYKDLYAMLRSPLSGEGRTAYCHVQPECVEEFGAAARKALGDALIVTPARQLIEAGMFGPDVGERVRQRAGDWILLGRDNWTVHDRLPGEHRRTMIGVHGGLSRDEMLTPLIVATS